MRHLIIYIALTAALLASCENDTYDKGEGAYSYLQADFVEAHANGEKEIDYVITDNGDSLSLVTPCAAAWAKTADSTANTKSALCKVNSVSYISADTVIRHPLNKRSVNAVVAQKRNEAAAVRTDTTCVANLRACTGERDGLVESLAAAEIAKLRRCSRLARAHDMIDRIDHINIQRTKNQNFHFLLKMQQSI